MENLFKYGLQSRSSMEVDTEYTPIGDEEIIMRRQKKQVPIAAKRSYSDYIPFYFTPYSIMMHNILTGYNVPKRKREDIIIVVSSLRDMQQKGYDYVFTNQHALSETGLQFYDKLEELEAIDWDLLNQRDFKRDPDDPGKLLRYQAEAMVRDTLPLTDIRGLVCYNDQVRQDLSGHAMKQNLELNIKKLPDWYN